MAEIDLENLKPQKISRDLRGKLALIYGEAGCGKTSLAA
jgi:putative ribosome biogenesis GTPase RsgA